MTKPPVTHDENDDDVCSGCGALVEECDCEDVEDEDEDEDEDDFDTNEDDNGFCE